MYRIAARHTPYDRHNMAEENAPSRIVVALLAIFLGWLGIHKFMLGNSTAGIIHVVATPCFGIGTLIGFIEGILYALKSDEEFHQLYVVEKKAWF